MATKTATAVRLEVLTVEQAGRIAALAETYAKHLTATLGDHPDEAQIAADVQAATSPAAKALIGAIEALSTEARYELVALVWCGMGEYPFGEARAYSQATADTGIAQYLAKKALVLSGYLRTALESLGCKI